MVHLIQVVLVTVKKSQIIKIMRYIILIPWCNTLLFGIFYKQDAVEDNGSVSESEGNGDEDTEYDEASVHLKYILIILIMLQFVFKVSNAAIAVFLKIPSFILVRFSNVTS